ncbi:MAG: phosphoglucosamine mutase [Phycisphaerae bacterium]|nr:phosphoglucosamine mutase [Phycisphaerae bacterium]
MPNAPLMLGVSGLRGIVGASLTAELAVRYAAAVGAWLMERAGSPAPRWDARAHAGTFGPGRVRVVLGFDGRIGGDMLFDAASAGLKSAGCDVLPAHVAMTPTLGVLVDAEGADAGLQITASHNPQEWNGLKVLLRRRGLKPGRVDACAPPKTLAEEIVARFHDGAVGARPWSGVGFEGPMQTTDAHARGVRDAMDELGVLRLIRGRRMPVLVDCVNGAGGPVAPDFLAETLGCRVTAVGERAGEPFWHAPEPTAENLRPVGARVRRARAAVGFCQDPDADRLALVDEKGRYVGEEYTLVLAAMALADLGVVRKGSVLAVNLSTSRMIEDVAARVGARVVRTAVGEANVVEAMKREKSVLGGEGNGGVIWPRITCVRDSLSGMALVLALMARTRKPLSELVRSTPAYAIEKRKVGLARKEDALPALGRLKTAYRDRPLDLQDGVRVGFERAWLHVRASNTEPIMRLIAEAPTADRARSILGDAARAIGP